MRIAITGASGVIGRQLVPRLLARGADLLLIGRSPAALASRFPSCEVGSYEELPALGTGCELLLHLAVINNDRDASWEDIERTNVDLAIESCLAARTAGIAKFAFVSSTLALEGGNQTPYARSKRMAEAKLQSVQGIAKTVLIFPAVVGDELSGKLAILNRLPGPFRRMSLQMLGALKPTVHIDRIADAVFALAGSGGNTASRSIVSDGQRANWFYRAGKRAFDLCFAIAVLLLLWWAMVGIWLLVRTQSPGPGLFRQARVGKGKREFTCYKFRTMLTSTPNVGTHAAPASAVTNLGRFLRRHKLDELPQVFNILANQMSLVGPRPCLPNQIELIEARGARGVFDITPGITGLAQVNGIDMSQPEVLAEWDEQYIRLQSLLLDLKIAIRTVLGGGSGDPIVYADSSRTKTV